MISQACSITGQNFSISEAEVIFYQKMNLPLPTMCFSERDRRRMSWRNERSLYKRKCTATNKDIISFYSTESTFPVYDRDYWWSDGWNGLDYGIDFNFSKTFAENWKSFRNSVPRMAMQRSRVENDYYGAYSIDSRNLYRCISCVESEDLIHCYQTNQSRDCIDCSLTVESELCYECLYCTNCYETKFSLLCENCNTCTFMKNCIGCSDCFGCVNLRNKQYHFLNQPCTKEEYEAKIAGLNLGNYSQLQELRKHFETFALQFPVPHINGKNNENVTGNRLDNCRNGEWMFESRQMEDCGYCGPMPSLDNKDCYDSSYSPGSELIYNCMSGVSNYQTLCMLMSWDMKNSAYCDECFYSENCFGCAGLKKMKHCIFNKSYTEHEYTSTQAKIESHMRETGEWGRFFDPALSPFGYNETIAQEWYPLTETVAIQRDFKWKKEEFKASPNIQHTAYSIPSNIADVDNSILDQVLTCESSGKQFRLVKKELQFYRTLGLPIPHLHPEIRHEQRIQHRFPRNLWARNCAQTNVEILCTYAPEKPEKVIKAEVYHQMVN